MLLQKTHGKSTAKSTHRKMIPADSDATGHAQVMLVTCRAKNRDRSARLSSCHSEDRVTLGIVRLSDNRSCRLKVGPFRDGAVSVEEKSHENHALCYMTLHDIHIKCAYMY